MLRNLVTLLLMTDAFANGLKEFQKEWRILKTIKYGPSSKNEWKLIVVVILFQSVPQKGRIECMYHPNACNI